MIVVCSLVGQPLFLLLPSAVGPIIIDQYPDVLAGELSVLHLPRAMADKCYLGLSSGPILLGKSDNLGIIHIEVASNLCIRTLVLYVPSLEVDHMAFDMKLHTELVKAVMHLSIT